MARDMSEAAFRTYVRRNVEKMFGDRAWGVRIGHFYSNGQIAANGPYVSVEWRWGFSGKLEAVVDCWDTYGLQESKEFTGDEAIAACVEWTTDKIIEVSATVNARTAPYEQGKRLYERALRGGSM